MTPVWPLLAESASHTFFRFARLQSMSEWWHWMLLLAACAGVLVYVVLMYWFDSVDLSRGVAWSLVLLRLAAIAGILFFFLDLEKRTEDREIKPSRAVILVDTSQSMGLRDAASSDQPSELSRLDRVVNELRDGQLIKQLRARHDVAVYRFDEKTEPAQVAFFPRLAAHAAAGDRVARAVKQKQQALRSARSTAIAGSCLAAFALLSFAVFLLFGRGPQHSNTSLALLATMVALVAAGIIFAMANLQAPDLSLRTIAGLETPDFAAEVRAELTREEPAPAEPQQPDVDPHLVPWKKSLDLRGTETRIGDALRSLVTQERGGPIAGLVLVTDGGNNAGIDCSISADAARAAGIPIFAVGLGSDRQPVNARVVDLEAPKRVYPGDKFNVTGYLQAYGLEGRLVSVELSSAPADETEGQGSDESGSFEEERSVRLAADGDVLTVKFEVSPTEAGTRLYRLKIIAPEQDIEKRDDQKTARIKIVERKTRVLLFAGGPTREFRFLRNQLYRDRDTTVDVLLQSGGPGMSQEADDVLFDFPDLADELFQYDAICAFDPDWLKLDELQLKLLDRWVAEQAGGLMVVAGPVYTPEWAGLRRGRDPRADIVKALYPVIFYSQGSPNLSLGRFGGEAAWPLSFTRDGLSAEFLGLEDDPIDSEAAWQSFDGVYGYYAVKDPKPGARVYARFSNPETSIDGELPIYAAAHFYGAGRVFFQASGEMWRLRASDPRYFETYYTKLIRWISQGRLLRDSSRGILLVDKDRCLLGDHVMIRAVLNDAQHQPLTLDEVPATLVPPAGKGQSIMLRKVQDAARQGMYESEITAQQEGDYRIELSPPQSTDELLTAEVRVRVPALEIEHPQRNDALLKELTQKTGGEYFIGFDAAMNRGGQSRASLATVLEPQDQIVFLPESIDSDFDQRLMGWLIALICGVLCLEWLTRRLSKLA